MRPGHSGRYQPAGNGYSCWRGHWSNRPISWCSTKPAKAWMRPTATGSSTASKVYFGTRRSSTSPIVAMRFQRASTGCCDSAEAIGRRISLAHQRGELRRHGIQLLCGGLPTAHDRRPKFSRGVSDVRIIRSANAESSFPGNWRSAPKRYANWITSACSWGGRRLISSMIFAAVTAK